MAADIAVQDTYIASHIQDAAGGATGAIRIVQWDKPVILVGTNTLFNEEHTIRQNTNDTLFMNYQNRLRLLDIFKDSETKATKTAPATKIDGNKLCALFHRQPNVQCPDNHSQAKGFLHMFRRHLLSSDAMKHKYTRASLIKQNDHYQYNTLLPTRRVFQESGLHPANMILNPIRCHTFASQVIDPADRLGFVPGDEVFPLAGQTLVMDQSFLSLFGFENCRIESTRIDNDTHQYRININGVNITHDNHHLHLSASHVVDYFCGNPIKNETVNGAFSSANAAGKIKLAALLVAKEMGDVVQVLTAFIYQSLYPERSYTITTCDMVVFMLCLFLNVKCIVVGHIGSEQDPTDKSYSSLRYEKFTNQHKYESIIDQLETLITMNQEKIDFLSLRLPLLGLYKGGQRVATHQVYGIRYPGHENYINFVKPEFINYIVHDLKQIQAAARHEKNAPGLIPTPQERGVLPDGVNSEGVDNYHSHISQIYRLFEEQFDILPIVTYDYERNIYVLTIGSSYTRRIPPGVVVYTLPKYDPVNGTPFSSIMRDFHVPSSPSTMLGKSSRVSKSITPFTVKEIRTQSQFKKLISKKKPSHKKGGALRSSVRRSMGTSVRKSMRKTRHTTGDTSVNPFIMDFYPVYYQYWTDDPGDLGEELEDYLDASIKVNSQVNSKNKRTWRSIDIHALLKKQVDGYLSRMGKLATQYRMNILSLMYDDFHVHSHTLFGKELEKLLHRIMKEHIVPYHQAAQKEEKQHVSLQMKEYTLQTSPLSMRPNVGSLRNVSSMKNKKRSHDRHLTQKRERHSPSMSVPLYV